MVIVASSLNGCGAYFNQPVKEQNASIGENTPITNSLKNLPKAKDKIVVGVYKFRDQTGQYKPSENGSNFSTAVTQGSTSILIKALEDSNWFIPIERENLSNLLQERNIIRSTRQEYLKNSTTEEQQLSPLLYAGVLLEGGIVSYDSNIITGGFGARYFGAGGSTRYRQDRVTVYLRLVSTSNGKILKTIYVSKTILSQSLDASLFRYVQFKRLLEVETGFTKNEPIQLAVTEAIEKAVEGLIIEGIKDDVWQSDAPISELTRLINTYETEKEESETALLYKRYFKERRAKYGIDIAGGAALIQGDYSNPVLKPALRAGIRYFLLPAFNINTSANLFWIANKNKFEEAQVSLDLNFEVIFLPNDELTPFIYLGGGYGATTTYDSPYLKIQSGVGLEYLLTDKFGLRTFAEINLTQSDKLDGVIAGVRDDNYWRFGIGVTYYFPKFNYDKKEINKHIKELSNVNEPINNNTIKE
jgi:curli production assembly/transport component CsgG